MSFVQVNVRNRRNFKQIKCMVYIYIFQRKIYKNNMLTHSLERISIPKHNIVLQNPQCNGDEGHTGGA